jgi:hypothetical protein
MSLQELKRSEMKSGGRLLLGDNTGDEAVMLRLIRFNCVGTWVSAGLLCMCTYS